MHCSVIFDMDGVLFDTERLCCSIWAATAREAGYVISDESILACVGRNDTDTRRIMLEYLGSAFPYDEFVHSVRTNVRSEMEYNGPPQKKGAYQLLNELKRRGIGVALATSTSEASARWMIEKAGFTSFFSAFAFGSEVSHGKPDPEIFLLARNRLGQNNSANCIVFEDSPAGIRASSSAGMKTVFVPDMIMPEPEVLNLVWKHIPDLEAALKPDFFTY